MQTMMDYNTLRDIDDIRRAKQQLAASISQSVSRLHQTTSRTLLPKDKTLLQSPIKLVRYSAYGITAYKVYTIVAGIIKFFQFRKRKE